MIEFPSCLLSSLHLSVSSFFHSLRSLVPLVRVVFSRLPPFPSLVHSSLAHSVRSLKEPLGGRRPNQRDVR